MFVFCMFLCSFKICSDGSIWNTAAGPDYSLFLVDGEDFQPSLYCSGQEESAEGAGLSDKSCLKSPTLLLSCSKVHALFFLLSLWPHHDIWCWRFGKVHLRDSWIEPIAPPPQKKNNSGLVHNSLILASVLFALIPSSSFPPKLTGSNIRAVSWLSLH